MNRMAPIAKATPLRFAALLILVFGLMYVGYQQLEAQNLVTCPEIVQNAVDAVGNNCGSLNRNSACYGFDAVEAEFSQPQPLGFFSQPSDRARLLELERLGTSPVDETLDYWGIALLSVQANLPDTLPGQSVIFMLLGDTEVENAVEPQDAFQTGTTITVTLSIGAQMFHDPSLNGQMVASVPPGTSLTADALSADGQWVRVAYNGMPGWLTRQVISSEQDIDSLPPIGETPMQAFYFRTSISGTQCNEAPNSLVVQGPENAVVDINANGADIQLGSTIALYLLPVDPMTMNYLVQQYGEIGAITRLMQIIVLDGHVVLNEGTDHEVVLETGETTFICLSEPQDLGIDGEDNDREVFDACPWAEPRPVTVEELEKFRELDGLVLNYPITLPLTLPTVTPTLTSTPRPTTYYVFVPSATPSPFPTWTPVPQQPQDNNNPPPSQPTAVPPTAVPPTDVPTCTDGFTFPTDVYEGDNATLIAAINAANDETCHPGADTINLLGSEGASFGFANAPNGSALPAITSTITINGDGYFYNIDLTGRYIYVAPSGNLTLNNMVFDSGNAPSGSNGGAILNEGVLTMNGGYINSSVAENGGGIYNSGTLTITNGDLESNSVYGGNGGNLYNAGTATINRTVIAYGSAINGGGIYSSGGSLSVLNSTISSSYSGGGINVAGGSATLNFVTIANNSGGGLFGAGITVKNSIVAQQSPNCSASLTSVAGNFSDDTSCAGFTTSSNLNLQVFNGYAHALNFPSDAIDAVDCTTNGGATVDGDQFGVGRPVDADTNAGPPDCDAGAFEYNP